jgi:large subunit ribosomal protein L17
MRHRVAHRKLGRRTEHRLALLRNLAVGLILHERIKTTLAKAKELRPFAERLITLGKRETLHARRRALSILPREEAVAKLFDTLSARFATRPGGYTRILRLPPRQGDGAPMAFIELVDYVFAPSESRVKEKKEKDKEKKEGEKAAPEAKKEKKKPVAEAKKKVGKQKAEKRAERKTGGSAGKKG